MSEREIILSEQAIKTITSGGHDPNDIVQRYFRAIPKAEQELSEWLPGIASAYTSGDHKKAMIWLQELALISFYAGFANARAGEVFACRPEDVVKNAMNPNLIPVIK